MLGYWYQHRRTTEWFGWGLRIPRGSPLAPGIGPVKPIKSMASPRVVPEEAVANGNAQWRKLGRRSCVTVLNKDRTCVFALPPVGESSVWMCWASTLAILCRTGRAGEGSFWNLRSRGWVLSLPRGAERPLPNCLGRLFCSCWPEDRLSLYLAESWWCFRPYSNRFWSLKIICKWSVAYMRVFLYRKIEKKSKLMSFVNVSF